MKKNFVNKLTAILATGVMALSLTACTGSQSVSGNVSGQNVESTLTSYVDHETASSTVLFSFEDIDVTLEDYYLFMVQYLYNFEVDPASLASPEVIQNANASILNEIKLETVEYKLALVEEVTPDAVDISDADLKADSFYNYFGQNFFDSFGISKEKVNELFERQVYIEALRQKTLSDLSDDYEADYKEQYADMQCFTIYYVLFPSVKYDEEKAIVLDDDGACIPLTESEMAEQLSLAEELRDKALENIDNGEDDGNLEELAIEYGVDHVSGVQRGYMGEYSQELNDLVAGMENGDISDIITNSGALAREHQRWREPDDLIKATVFQSYLDRRLNELDQYCAMLPDSYQPDESQ